jgi:hypothetical protein
MVGSYEERMVDDDYLELVLFTEDVDQWHEMLSRILGPPVKPAGIEPSEKDLRATEKSGGIWVHQTLFEKACFDGTVIAKFWPWQDGVHTTLKIAKLAHIEQPSGAHLPSGNAPRIPMPQLACCWA